MFGNFVLCRNCPECRHPNPFLEFDVSVQNHRQTALVLGATGGIGGELARQMREAGWRVRALTRSTPPADEPQHGQQGSLQWLRGDAMCRDDVLAAARGCAVIVHAVNPPGYRRWAELVLPMIDNSIAAARAEGATLVLPGTLYNHGPDAFPLLHEDSPQHPVTRKGAIRVAMEQRLRQATESGPVLQGQAGRSCRVLILRAGDFFGPRCGNSWFAQGLVRPGRPVRRILNPAAAGVGHQWAYLPDVARTLIELLEQREQLPAFASFHMGGHWDADGQQMVQAIQRVVQGQGGGLPRVRAFPWPLLQLASPFVTTLRELLEMRYLWRTPVRLDNRRLLATLGHEPHTPLDVAVLATLQGLGCLPASAQPTAATTVAAGTSAGLSALS